MTDLATVRFCSHCNDYISEGSVYVTVDGIDIHRACICVGDMDMLCDEIERMQAMLARFARYADNFDRHEYSDPSRPLLHKDHEHPSGKYGPTIGDLRQARAALNIQERT